MKALAKIVRKIFFITLLFSSASTSYSQNPVQKDSIAYSMEEALKNPLDIRVLDLRKQKLKEIENRFDRLVNLHTIYLDKNKLKSLPKSLSECRGLKYLSIANNKFTEIPEVICSFKELQTLDISTNEVAFLPACMAELTKLKSLLMVGNEISYFPEELEGLNLQEIDMRIIQMSENEQTTIKELFPNATIRFSKPCNCFGSEESDQKINE